jgi:hypothetical protein
MGIDIRQTDDGALGFVDNRNNIEVARIGGTRFAGSKVAVVNLQGGIDTAGGIGSFVNPENRPIFVYSIRLDITTRSTAASTISIGTAANATTSSANLIDTLDVGTAAGVFDNNQDKGTLGRTRQRLTAGQFITVSRVTGATAGLVGVMHIEYTVL